MSYIPSLKKPMEQSRREFRSSSRINSTNGVTNTSTINPRLSQVRFHTDTPLNKTSISLDISERERRKREALEFLKRETRKSNYSTGTKPSSSTDRISSRYSTSNVRKNPETLKTYELLGENPIRRVPPSSKYSIYDDQTIKNITKDSYIKNPLRYNSRIGDIKSRVSKPSVSSQSHNSRNNSLLNSLSNLGSKVFRSILYNEQDTNINEPFNNSSYNSLNSMDYNNSREEFLKNEIKQKELDLQLAERKRYLDELNRKIEETEKRTTVESPIQQAKHIDKQIEKLDERLQNILEGVQSSSNEKLLKEMESIRNELTALRRKQESNNMRFESKFEDMKLENQLNRQKFDQLFNELEEKRKQLDVEKNMLIKKLKMNDHNFRNDQIDSNFIDKETKNSTKKQKLTYIDSFDADDTSSEAVIDRNYEIEDDQSEEEKMENDYDDDILRYIIKNRRKSNIKSKNVRNKIRKIRNNLNNIDSVTKK